MMRSGDLQRRWTHLPCPSLILAPLAPKVPVPNDGVKNTIPQFIFLRLEYIFEAAGTDASPH